MMALAARQQGFVSRQQLLDLGLSRAAIGRRAEGGVLAPCARGVFSVGPARGGPGARLAMATLLCPADGVVSHGLSLESQDLVDPVSRPVELTITRGRPRRQPGVLVHRTRWLPPADVVTIEGVRHTTAARTIYDVAGRQTVSGLERLLERAATRERLELTHLHRVIHERTAVPGRTKLLAAIESLRETTGRARSEFERVAVALCVDAGLPEPKLNAIVDGLEVDLSWWWTRGLVELDGFRFHFTPLDVARNAERRATLRGLGRPILTLSWFDVTQRSQDTVERIRAFTERHRIDQ